MQCMESMEMQVSTDGREEMELATDCIQCHLCANSLRCPGIAHSCLIITKALLLSLPWCFWLWFQAYFIAMSRSVYCIIQAWFIVFPMPQGMSGSRVMYMDSILNMWIGFFALFSLRAEWMIERLSQAMRAALGSFRSDWWCHYLLPVS